MHGTCIKIIFYWQFSNNKVSFNVIRGDGLEVKEVENQSKKMRGKKKQSKTKPYKYIRSREVV
jgi:hypothetical protein